MFLPLHKRERSHLHSLHLQTSFTSHRIQLLSSPRSERANEHTIIDLKSQYSYVNMASTYEVRRSDIAGEGTFATRRIRRGQRIMSCRPLVMNRAFRSVPTSQTIREILSWEHDSTKAFKEAEFRKVTANAQCIEKVRSISNRVDQLFEDCSILTNEEDMRPPTERDLETVLCQVHDVERSPDMQLRVAKFLCNSLFLDGNTFNGNGLFEELWKVNHSCRPNAVATWNEETQRMNLHALRTIRPDKEIFISYMPWDLLDVSHD